MLVRQAEKGLFRATIPRLMDGLRVFRPPSKDENEAVDVASIDSKAESQEVLVPIYEKEADASSSRVTNV